MHKLLFICIASFLALIGCLKLRVIFRKRATNYWALLTYEDKAPYASTPHYSSQIGSTQGVRNPHRMFQNWIKLPYRVPGATTQGAIHVYVWVLGNLLLLPRRQSHHLLPLPHKLLGATT